MKKSIKNHALEVLPRIAKLGLYSEDFLLTNILFLMYVPVEFFGSVS